MITDILDAPLSIMMTLCPQCKHSKACPGPKIVDAADDGVSCSGYNPVPDKRSRLSEAHILALPDREPCSDCACRKGSQPNRTPHTVADFNMCVRERQPFLCHSTGQGRICAGWLRAVKARLSNSIADFKS
jgi:hypothetical protein